MAASVATSRGTSLVACVTMAIPQGVVAALLFHWDTVWAAAAVAASLLAQIVLMRRLLSDPAGRAPWYNATGTSLYVIGMLIAAFGLRAVAG